MINFFIFLVLMMSLLCIYAQTDC